MEVHLAGRVTVASDGVLIDEGRFPGRQGRLVFAYLAAEHRRPVPREELAEALWGEEPPASWEKALTVVASKLRALLAETGSNGGGVLSGAFGCYRLDLPEGSWIDVVAAARAVSEAEVALTAGELRAAKDAAADAESLLREPLLPGETGAWVEEKRRGLADLRARALAILAEACLRTGEPAAAVGRASEAIELEPFRESGYRLLIEAHVAAGNRGEALRVYERCRRLLAEELGAYPSPETDALYRSLLEAPAPPRREPAAHEPARAGRERPRRRRLVVGAVALGAAAALAVGLHAAESGGTHANGIAANAVGLIDVHGGDVRSEVALSAAPTSVASGSGSVWVTDAFANAVSRIDPATGTVVQTIPVGDSPNGIAAGGGGVWVANHDDGTVSWISPQSDTVVRRIHVGNGPTAVAFGAGSVWVTNSDDRTVSRIDPAIGHVVATVAADAVGRGIAVGGGSVWVTDEATGTVVRIDPATNRVVNRAPVGTAPAGIAYGDGAVWVADDLGDTVSELDPATLAVRAAVPVAGSPSALAFADGSVWIAAEFGDRVVRIDPRTLRETATSIANRPEGVAAGPRGIWVAVQASGTGHYGGRLVVADDTRLDSIDPALADDTDSVQLRGLAYDGLTGFRRAGGSAGTQLVPDLAAALPLPTDGGRSYTFRLRSGIRYSDGTPLRARDFRRALERMFALGSPLLQNSALTEVVGASACAAGSPCDLSQGVVVDDPRALTFRLVAPDPRFLLSLVDLVPVPPGTPPHDVATTPVPSTGPYAIDTYVPGRGATLVRNARFRSWSAIARPDGYPDEIVWRFFRSADRALREVLTGRADVLLEDAPSNRLAMLAARYPGRLHLVPQQATAFVFLNTRRAPFDDIRVRRAVNLAVDRREVAALHGGAAVAEPTCQILPPTMPGYRRYCPYTVDPSASGEWRGPDLPRARALVAASGTRGEHVVVWAFPYFGREAHYFVGLLRRLGYRARLHEQPDDASYFGALQRNPSIQAGFAGWFGLQLSADVFATLGCRYAPNWARFCDSRVDTQVWRLVRAEGRDPDADSALAARIDRELVDEAPWVPLFTPRFADFVSSRVGDYQANPNAAVTVLLDQLWVR